MSNIIRIEHRTFRICHILYVHCFINNSVKTVINFHYLRTDQKLVVNLRGFETFYVGLISFGQV